MCRRKRAVNSLEDCAEWDNYYGCYHRQFKNNALQAKRAWSICEIDAQNKTCFRPSNVGCGNAPSSVVESIIAFTIMKSTNHLFRTNFSLLYWTVCSRKLKDGANWREGLMKIFIILRSGKIATLQEVSR